MKMLNKNQNMKMLNKNKHEQLERTTAALFWADIVKQLKLITGKFVKSS